MLCKRAGRVLPQAAELLCVAPATAGSIPQKSFFILIIFTAASYHVARLKYLSLRCCWNAEACGFVFKSACEVSGLKSICFLRKCHSRLAAETQRPWLRYEDLQVEQNSQLSCQSTLQSALLIRPRNNASLELGFGEFI